MTTYYATVGAAYEQKKYCDAVAPLTYLRTVPHTLPKKDLGALATWPDQRLATSLYECASDGLASGDAGWPTLFGELLTTFPGSEQAAQVEPAVKSAVDRTARGVRGGEPCAAVERLRSLSAQITSVSGGRADITEALGEDADRAGRSADSGAYACGVDQYKDGDFDAALTTMNGFVAKNEHDKNRAGARKIAIAAEIAKTVRPTTSPWPPERPPPSASMPHTPATPAGRGLQPQRRRLPDQLRRSPPGGPRLAQPSPTPAGAPPSSVGVGSDRRRVHRRVLQQPACAGRIRSAGTGRRPRHTPSCHRSGWGHPHCTTRNGFTHPEGRPSCRPSCRSSSRRSCFSSLS